jgi:putative cardiolipin synthase
MKLMRCFISLTLLLLLAACTGPTVRDDYPEPEPSFTSEPGQDVPFADLETAFSKTHGSQKSGFLMLENNTEALNWRLALIDEARYSLDVQYYLWYGDDSGRLILKRILDAAKRGVRVRLVADGILLVGKGKTIAALETHPNIEE